MPSASDTTLQMPAAALVVGSDRRAWVVAAALPLASRMLVETAEAGPGAAPAGA